MSSATSKSRQPSPYRSQSRLIAPPAWQPTKVAATTRDPEDASKPLRAAHPAQCHSPGTPAGGGCTRALTRRTSLLAAVSI